MGLPVVTSNIRPITDLLDPDSALFIDTATKETTRAGIVEKISALIKDPEMMRALSINAVKNAGKYSVEKHRSALREFFSPLS